MDEPARVSGQWSVYLVLPPFPLLSWTLPKTVFYLLWPWSKETRLLLTKRVGQKQKIRHFILTKISHSILLSLVFNMPHLLRVQPGLHCLKCCEIRFLVPPFLPSHGKTSLNVISSSVTQRTLSFGINKLTLHQLFTFSRVCEIFSIYFRKQISLKFVKWIPIRISYWLYEPKLGLWKLVHL